MYAEVFEGLHQDPRGHLNKLFTQKYDEMVLIKDIRLVSFCEHHLLPVVGQAHVAYIPNGKVIGLSKIPRVVDVLAKRPQMQERLTEDLADLLMRELDAKGVAVVIEASHSCMTIRGVNKPNSTFVTSAMRGVFKERLATRTEVMSLICGSRSRLMAHPSRRSSPTQFRRANRIILSLPRASTEKSLPSASTTNTRGIELMPHDREKSPFQNLP